MPIMKFMNLVLFGTKMSALSSFTIKIILNLMMREPFSTLVVVLGEEQG
jgi:hypothetical protein